MSATNSKFEYRQLPWGDLIYGTKDQLQELGIAVDSSFPGEPGGPKRVLHVLDPRGFKATVERSYKEGVFTASIPFPGRDSSSCEYLIIAFAPGVMKTAHTYADVFVGTAEALESAGLLRLDQLPGQPGMRKLRVTIFADGTLPTGAPTANNRRCEEPGAKKIERASKSTYEVRVMVPRDEEERRKQAIARAREEYEVRMRSLPRPAPLNGPAHSLASRARGNLRLVWSAQSAAV